MLGQSLNQKMLQKLSPQQIQLMKLLQIPVANLEQRIKEELEANPALEEGPDRDLEAIEGPTADREEADREEKFELDDYLENYIEEDPTTYRTRVDRQAATETSRSGVVAGSTSFHEYLESQLKNLRFPNETAETIAHQIVGSIDSDGYLRREPESIVDDLAFNLNLFVERQDVVRILEKIQQMDPPGVGARDLRECLLIQLDQKIDRKEQLSSARLADLVLARRIVAKYFDAFSKKHYDKLLDQLGADEDELRDAMGEILKLNPKPASGYESGGGGSPYVVPDFQITNDNGELNLELNGRNAPDLFVSDQYQAMLKGYRSRARKGEANRKEKEAAVFIKQKIDSARWFIDAIEQRRRTLYSTMYAIMQYQHDYFITGDKKKLRPMILKDIAEIVDLDVSTISRVVNSKFVQTEFGTFLLKDFFSEGMTTDEGEEVSSIEIKKVLEEIVAAENKKKPLSDAKLAKALAEQGYDIARRTVAKYREQLNIPVARLRKEL